MCRLISLHEILRTACPNPSPLASGCFGQHGVSRPVGSGIEKLSCVEWLKYPHCHTRESGYPVCRVLSVPSPAPLEYWVARSSRAMTTMGGLQTQLRDSRRSFRARFGRLVPPSPVRGRRECRAPDAPASRVCRDSGSDAHALVRSHRNHPAFPAQWFYGFLRALPGDRAFLPPSPARSLLPRNLTPASGRQDHTTSPSACRLARQARRPRPPHPAPRFVTLRNAPLSGAGR